MDLQIDKTTLAGVPMFKVSGEIDRDNVERLREPVQREVASGAARVVVDLTHVIYLDSAAVSALYAVIELLPDGGWLGLLAPGPNTSRILELAGLLSCRECLVFADFRSAELAVEEHGAGLDHKD